MSRRHIGRDEKILAGWGMFILFLVLGLSTESMAYTWEHYNGHYYTITKNIGTWHQARDEAVAAGGYLVTINDAAEETWLRQTFSLEYTYWIGLTDEKEEGRWVWVGEDSSYLNWAPGEPNNMTPNTSEQGWEGFHNDNGEDYTVMNWIIAGTAYWNDVPILGPWFAQDDGGVWGIIEARALPPAVPLPTSALLFGPVMALLLYRRHRQQKNNPGAA
ncbi:MAG: hypothetical protein FJ135_05120 [Deltaproteobacteria bacterium]|nr:hypothetical protein [Deltaproteobacteria bacterium]